MVTVALPSYSPTDFGRSARVSHLLKVARQMFIASGYEAVSLDALARQSNVSKETIYRYFANKEALFRAAAEGLRASYSIKAEAIADRGGAPESVLASHALAIHASAVESGYLAATWLNIAIARALPDEAYAMREDALQRLEPLRHTLESIAAAHVPVALAADFGAMAVQGPRHLMGSVQLKAADRDALAQRTARFFLFGAAKADGSLQVRNPTASSPIALPASRPTHIKGLIAVALQHFLTRGFEGASLDDIGAEAHVGRGTLYRHFGNKAGLFEAVMLDAAAKLGGELLPPSFASGTVGSVLSAYLGSASLALTGGETVALFRLAIAEAKRAPDVAREVFVRVREPWTNALARWLEKGAGVAEDPEWIADQLLTIASIGNRPLASDRDIDDDIRHAAVQRAVAIFTGGFTAALRC